MSQIKQKCYFSDGDPNNTITLGAQILDGSETTSKISIMAPSGCTVKINNKDIVIGQSGLFDLDNENIIVDSLEIPDSEDNSDERTQFREELEELRGDLITFCNGLNPLYGAEETQEQIAERENNSVEFCSWVKMLPSSNSEIINGYLEVQEDHYSGNQGLHDVIINYVVD